MIGQCRRMQQAIIAYRGIAKEGYELAECKTPKQDGQFVTYVF
jgi:hypothetical protein